MGEKWKEVFKKITLEDLENDFTIRYSNSSIADYTKSKKLNDIQNFMNYWQVLWNDPARNAYIIDQEAIIKKVAELLDIDWALLSPEELQAVREQWWVATATADIAVQSIAQQAQAEAQQAMMPQEWDVNPEAQAAEMQAEAALQETAPIDMSQFEIAPTVVE